MELILINNEKLKIILTNEDMKSFNIDIETLDYSNVTTKRVFWDILDKAKETAGFNADKSKLFVQVFPSNDGGCEMFVTKFSSTEKSVSHRKKKIYKITQKDNEKRKGMLIVLGFDDLCRLCRRMANDNLTFTTNLYYDSSGNYYFIVYDRRNLPTYISDDNIPKIPDYIYEYGKVLELTEQILLHLNEYCTIIECNNAIKRLSIV